MNHAERIFFLSRKLYLKKVPILPKLFNMANRILFTCDIPYTCDIHPSVKFLHNGLGVVIHGSTKVGKGCVILHDVTLGVNTVKNRTINGKAYIAPIIGENVLIGTGAKVLGPVIIGKYSKIGAGSVVIKDVSEYSVAVGSPAKVVRKLSEDELINQ